MSDRSLAHLRWVTLFALAGCGADTPAAPAGATPAAPAAPAPAAPADEPVAPVAVAEPAPAAAEPVAPDEPIAPDEPVDTTPGPERESAELAAWAGWIDEDGDEHADVLGSVTSRDRTFVLVALPTRDPRASELGATERVALHLARTRRLRGEEERHVREASVRLYDLAIVGGECEVEDVATPTELRARDLDADGEVEVTVIVAAAATARQARNATPLGECGAVAFLVGGDDLGVQARFTRAYRAEHIDAGGEATLDVETTWRLLDTNGDGRADLRVTEAYRYRDEFSGDWGGDDVGTIPGHRERRSARRSADCPYDVASDRWICPAPALGAQLLRPREVLLRPEGASLAPPFE
ncbi:MAG: hypothetical protein KF729_23930 [Sandaracinaceae bacterium]|nr:hypothetical protein [Sandaracinaceae bacterium]